MVEADKGAKRIVAIAWAGHYKEGEIMKGQGKYDDWCTKVREATEGEGTVLIVINGNRGHGISLQGTSGVLRQLPEILRKMATDLESDVKGFAREH